VTGRVGSSKAKTVTHNIQTRLPPFCFSCLALLLLLPEVYPPFYYPSNLNTSHVYFIFFQREKKSVLGTDDDDDDDDTEMFIPGFTLLKGMGCACAQGGNACPPPPPPSPGLWHLGSHIQILSDLGKLLRWARIPKSRSRSHEY